MFNFVQHRRIFFSISLVAITFGLLAMVFSFVTSGRPFRIGIDFRSGTRIELAFEAPVSESQLRLALNELGYKSPDVTAIGDDINTTTWQIRTEFIDPQETQKIFSDIEVYLPPVDRESSSIQSVSPAIGQEVTRAALIAIIVAALIILFYIMFSFRQVQNPFRYGACAVIAMIHDLIIIFGFIAITGLIMAWEIDALFLTAALTVAGFSLQDTIVVFDRIRENSRKRPLDNYEMTVNRSVLETVHRSLATQLSAMFVLVAILLFGGSSIKPFIGVLFVGLLSGTYSSLFTAVPLLVAWEKGEIPFLKKSGL
jgi:preprotein translocase SecF subunit